MEFHSSDSSDRLGYKYERHQEHHQTTKKRVIIPPLQSSQAILIKNRPTHGLGTSHGPSRQAIIKQRSAFGSGLAQTYIKHNNIKSNTNINRTILPNPKKRETSLNYYNTMGNELSTCGCGIQEVCSVQNGEKENHLTANIVNVATQRMRFSAEIYKLSSDRGEWVKLTREIVTLTTTERYHLYETFLDIKGSNDANQTVFSSFISSKSEIKKSSERFVIWSTDDGTIFALNFLFSKDAEEFCAILSTRILYNPISSSSILAQTAVIISLSEDNQIMEDDDVKFKHCVLSLHDNVSLIVRIKSQSLTYSIDLLDCIVLYDPIAALMYLCHPSKVFAFKSDRPRMMYQFFVRALHESNKVLTSEIEKSVIAKSLRLAQSKIGIEERDEDVEDMIISQSACCLQNFMLHSRIYAEDKDAILDDKILLSQVSTLAAQFIVSRHALQNAHMYCAARRDLSIKKFFTPAISIKRSQPVWDLKNSNRRSIVGSKSSDAITSIPEKESSPGTPQELSIANLKAMYIKGSGASGKSSEENTCNDGDKLSNGKEVPRKKRLGETYKLSELDVKKEEMLVRNISELVESEQVFAKDLINLKRQSPHILGPQLRLIAEELHALHHNFVSCLEEARDGLTLVETSGYNFHCRVKDAIMRMCALFINKSNRFKIYSDYSAAYSLWLQKVSNDSSFKEKLKAYNLKENSKCENVESLLIKPIQRILRYPLFLEKIVECCRGETLESKQAKQALERLQELATYINEMQRLREQYGIRLDDFARTNKGYFKEKGMNVDLRELMIFAHVKIHQTSVNGSIKEKEKNAEAVVLVFQTLVLLFIPEKKKDKAHKVIPISECIIIAPKEESVDMSTSQTSNAPTPHLLQIIHTDPNQKHPSVYLLSCTHSEIKSQLLKSLNKAIKMKNVKNTRPISGASQSDRGYESEK